LRSGDGGGDFGERRNQRKAIKEMAKKNVKFMLTAFRDGFQSVIGARVLSKDFLPCVEEAYAAGVRWFEAGGGARFQSCYFYCREDAFDVMDAFRKAAADAVLRGGLTAEKLAGDIEAAFLSIR
jgi:pyruvate/oxaloacetate carboxyltransferase